jgi:hypothetical protein
MSAQAKHRCLMGIVGCTLWLLVDLLGLATLAQGQTARHSQEAGADISKLRDITGIERIAAPPASRVWQVAAASAVAILALLALTTWSIRRFQPRPKLPLSFSQHALHELERLGEFATCGDSVEAYHTCLSDIVRHYLQAGFNIPATQRTNEEFFELLQIGEALTPEQREGLGQFLKRCDMAKFAAAQFTASECETTRCLARQFVEATTPSHRSARRDRRRPRFRRFTESSPPSEPGEAWEPFLTPENEGVG